MTTTTLRATALGLTATLLCACPGGGDQTTDTDTTGGTGTTTGTTALPTTGSPEPLTPADLEGTWVSKGCEIYPTATGGESYLKRTFVLTATTWHLELEIFAENTCATKLLTGVVDGPYSMGEVSLIVPGATEGDFGIETIEVTPHAQIMVDTFTAEMCGSGPWTLDVAQDVSETGCLDFKKVADCPQEHDIAAFMGDELFFGERVTDLCTPDGRPKTLDTHGLVKG